jgi:hypothetical protein
MELENVEEGSELDLEYEVFGTQLEKVKKAIGLDIKFKKFK